MMQFFNKLIGPWLPLAVGVLVLALVLMSGLWTVAFLTRTIEREERLDLLMRAGTVALLIDSNDIATLAGDASDLENPTYLKLKKQFTRIVAFGNDDTRFVYLVGVEGGKQFFYVDSEPPTSPDYSPPGQVYKDATPTDLSNYRDGRAYTKGPYTDAWGTFYTAYVPIKDASQKVVAAVGIDIIADQIDLRVKIVQNAVTVIFSLIGLLVLVLTLIGRNVVLVKFKN